MKKRIDFYTDDFKPKRLWFSFRQGALSGLVLLMLLISWGGGLFIDIALKQKELTQLAKQIEVVKQQGISLVEQEQQHIASQALIQELEQLRQKLDAENFLLSRLKGKQFEQQHSFANVLYDLARLTPERISLTRIYMSSKDMELNGYALSGIDVPQWIQDFGKAPSLARFSFADLVLQRDENESEYLFFILRTQPPQKKGL